MSDIIRLPEIKPIVSEKPINIAQLVTHNDPFNPNDKTILLIPSGASIYQVLKDFEYDIEFYDLVIAKNQEILDMDFIVEEGDVISFSLVPKGGGGNKQIFAIVAMIALTVAAPYAAGAIMGATAGMVGAGVYGGMMGAAIFGTLQAGIMIAGSMLISSLFKPNVPSAPNLDSFEQSTTYGWNTTGNSLAQGGAVPVLYGTHRITPQYIGKYLKTEGDVQVLKALLALGEGPLDSINSIQVNDQDIASYTNIYYETRMGTNNQLIIEDFNDTWSDQGVNKKLTDSSTWQYATTSGDACTSIVVGIVCPQGLFYANDAGGLDPYTVYLDIEFKPKTSLVWENFTNSLHVVNTTYYYVDQNPVVPAFGTPVADLTGPYDVYRGTLQYKDATDSFVTVPVYVETVATLPADATGQAAYPPNTIGDPQQIAWVALRQEGSSYFAITGSQSSAIRRSYTASGLAPDKYDVRVRFFTTPDTTSRYSSTTYFEFLQEAISDDFIYPNTALLGLSIQATDQLSGGLPKVTCIASRTTGTYGRLDNPAWACLDLLINNRYGAGVPIERIDLQSFQDWADYCTSKNYTVNIYLDQGLNLSQSLQLIGQLGRGTVMQYGSDFRALVDKPNILPTQGFLFSMGNIIQNSFSEAFLPLKDRANIIEVTFYNIDNDYERETIEVSQGNYDLVNQVNKTSINLIGCVTKEQAIKQAVYHLNQNRFLTITASWEASIDSIHCQVGDIVNVAHDVPQWGYSGRIVSNTSNSITIDRNDLIMEIGKTYYIQVSDANTDEQVYVQVLSITDNILAISGTIGILGEYSVYSFGEVNRHAKQMRVLSISTAGDLKRKISAIEYNENVFLDTVDIPLPTLVPTLNTSRLVVTEYLKQYQDGSIEPVVQLSWNGARLSYDVLYKKSNALSYTSAGTARSTNFEIFGLQEGVSYDFSVDGIRATYIVQGKLSPPPPVTGLTGSESGSNYYLNWVYAYKPLDFSHFEVYKDSILIGNTTDSSYIHFDNTSTTKVFMVLAVDTTGNKSLAITVSVAISSLQSVLNLKAYYVNEATVLAWDKIEDLRSPVDYEIRMGTVWNSGYIIGRTITPEYTVAANGDYMVKAHYNYSDGNDIYSTTEASLTISGAVLPKNIVATFDEKATGWLGTKTNMVVDVSGNLKLATDPVTGFVYSSGTYEIPSAHIIDIGTAQQCRVWVDYKVDGLVTNIVMNDVTVFDNWSVIDGYSDKYNVIVQIAVAQNDGVFGPWTNFVVGDYVGRKFKFRGLFYSLDPYTTCILSKANFYVDMPDKLQSTNSVAIPATTTAITYPIAFQAVPNLQVTIVNAQSGDTIQITNELTTGFSVAILNAGVMVARSINWLAKGY